MRILVTGGAGFIGSHVVDRLLERGHEVRIYDMLLPTYHLSGVEHYRASLLDFEALCFAMNGIDVVYHLAAVADVKAVLESPHYAENINVRGTINVLEACRRVKTKRVIYGSTTWVYSNVPQERVDELTPLAAPDHLYTATKIAAEHYCQCYARLYNLDCTILRYGIPYGPRARGAAVLPTFVRKALRGEALQVAGDGSHFRQFVYVEDLAEGNVLALADVARNQIYNLDGQEKVTVLKIAETVQKLVMGARIEFVKGRPGDFSGKEVSSEKAARELKWRASTPFEEGVRRFVEWYRKTVGE